MAKIDKKRKNLEDRIKFLRAELFKNLKQKTSNTAEISISEYMDRIEVLEKQLAALK